MNILLCERINSANEYIEQLAKSYQLNGHCTVFDVQNFLFSSFLPDFVHIQWPEAIYRWRHNLPENKETLNLIKQRLDLYSSNKIPIVYTAHNFFPHEYSSEFDKNAYKIILNSANIVVHHGNASIPLIKSHFPECLNAKHIVCPHGPYPYKPEDGLDARKFYGLSEFRYVFLNFGRQRSNKGFDFIKQVFKKLKNNNATLFTIGPRMVKPSSHVFFKILNLFKQTLIEPRFSAFISKFSKKSKCVLRPVCTDEIPKIISAVDVFFLGHQEGLNSGILALAASYGKPIVYPDLGNFSDQLSGWPWKESYKAGNIVSAVKALKEMMERLAPYAPGNLVFDNSDWLTINSWNKHVQIVIKEVQKYYQ